MSHFNEENTESYNWDERGVYVIEPTDYVEGGKDGVSNRQAEELTKRTRNLHTRMSIAEGEIDSLQEQLPISTEATLRSAKEYTDGEIAGVQNEMEVADATTLRTAKDYADMIVAALVDNTPEALNTLQELAAALGDNPNFATDVLQAIGERATMAQVNAALAGKADTNHGHNYADADFTVKNLFLPYPGAIKDTIYNKNILEQGYSANRDFFKLATTGHSTPISLVGYSNGLLTWNEHTIYHSGNDALYKHYADAVGNLNDATTVGSYSYGPATHNRPSPYGVVNVISNNIGWVAQTAYQTESTNVFYRQQTNGAAWSSWQLLYHSGNLKIIRGSVGANRQIMGGNGFQVSPSNTTDEVIIYHGLGTAAYSIVTTIVSSNTEWQDNVAAVTHKGILECRVRVTNGANSATEFAPFDFIIMPY